MKRMILAFLLCIIISSTLYSQSDIGIFGINRTTDPFENFLGKLDLENGQISNLNILPSSFGGFGSQYSPTIDPIGNRYFIMSSSKLWTIDLNTGVVLDTLDIDGNDLWFMQYNFLDNTIYGINRTTDPFENFLGKLDLENGQISNLNILPSSFGGFGSQYSPTIDPIGNRYFIMSSSKLWAIDLNTGVVLDTFNMDGDDLWYMQYNYKESITGIKQITGINSIKIYPNPTKTYINIESIGANKREIKIRLSDIRGHIFRDKYISNNLERINISNLSKGIYILEISENQNMRIEKIIKY